MATGNVEMFAEVRCTVLNGRTDLGFKIIMLIFDTVFFLFVQ